MYEEDDILLEEEDVSVEAGSRETPLADEFGLQGPHIEAGILHMPRLDMLILSDSLNKMEKVSKEKEITVLRMDKIKREHRDLINGMEARRLQCGDLFDKYHKNHKKLLNAFQEKYEIDFNSVTYDDETGIVRTLDNHDVDEDTYLNLQEAIKPKSD